MYQAGLFKSDTIRTHPVCRWSTRNKRTNRTDVQCNTYTEHSVQQSPMPSVWSITPALHEEVFLKMKQVPAWRGRKKHTPKRMNHESLLLPTRSTTVGGTSFILPASKPRLKTGIENQAALGTAKVPRQPTKDNNKCKAFSVDS